MKKLLKILVMVLALPTFISAMESFKFSSSLVVSAEVGNYTDVKKRLDAGEKVNQVDGEGFTALYLACEYNHQNIALLLLERGADPTILPEFMSPSTPLHHAIRHGALVVCEGIIKRICLMHMPHFDHASYMRVLTSLCTLDFLGYGLPVEVVRNIWCCTQELGYDVLRVLFGSDVQEPIQIKMARAIEVLGRNNTAHLLATGIGSGLTAFLALTGAMNKATVYEWAVEQQKNLSENTDSEKIERCGAIVDLLEPDTLHERLPGLILKWFKTLPSQNKEKK